MNEAVENGIALRGLLLDFGGVLDDPDEPSLVEVTRTARALGLRTALVSNSAPAHLPTTGDAFDALVFSEDPAVGAAKPDPAAYWAAARRIGVEPNRCVFVDDVRTNVLGAVRAGMVGVHHRDAAATLAELEALFELNLAADLR